MAFDKQGLEQLGGLFDKQHRVITKEVGELLDVKLDLEHKLIVDEVGELLDVKLESHRSMIMLDVRTLLGPIIEDIGNIKERLDQLFRLIHEDIGLAFKEIESLKRTVRKLEKRIVAVERR